MSEPIPAPFDADPPPPPEPPEYDGPCLRCGYELSGLDLSGRCPECGTPIARSLHGALLVYANPSYLRTLQIGAGVVFWGLLIAVIDVFFPCLISMASGFGFVGLPAKLLGFIASGALIIGWWMLSTPDPAFRRKDPGGKARLVLRIAVCAGAFFWLVELIALFSNTFLVSPTLATLHSVFSVLKGVAWLVTIFAGISYIILLARRARDPGLIRQARTVRTLAIVTVTVIAVTFGAFVLYGLAIAGNVGNSHGILIAVGCGGTAAFFGAILLVIVWVIMYLVLLHSLYGELRRMRAMSERYEGAA